MRSTERERIVRLHRAGWTRQEIQDETGVSFHRQREALDAAGIFPRRGRPRLALGRGVEADVGRLTFSEIARRRQMSRTTLWRRLRGN